MTYGRRSNDPALEQQAFNRLAQRIDESLASVSDRIESGFDRVHDRIDRLDRDMAAGELDRESAQREVGELRRDLGELRDAMGLGDGKKVEAAARGAAQGVLQAAAPKPFIKTWTGAMVAIALGFTATVTALDKLPSAVRKIESFWLYMRGPDEVKKAPEKALTDGR